MKTDPQKFKNPHSFSNKLCRALWNVVHLFLFRTSPWFAHRWRIFLLRLFGAKIGNIQIRPSAKVWAPWKLQAGDGVSIDSGVFLYNVFGLTLEDRAIVSRNSFLCTASHDYTDMTYPLIGAAIRVGRDSWVAADVYIGPGVQVGEGVVVAARSVVVKDCPAWSVMAGHPAKVIKTRQIKS